MVRTATKTRALHITLFGNEEPVFILRGKEAASVPALLVYAKERFERGATLAEVQGLGLAAITFMEYALRQ